MKGYVGIEVVFENGQLINEFMSVNSTGSIMNILGTVADKFVCPGRCVFSTPTSNIITDHQG